MKETRDGKHTVSSTIKPTLVMLLIAGSLYAQPERPSAEKKQAGFQTNEEVILALHAQSIDLMDSLAVFRFVVSNLDDEVMMFPTENYYYFIFNAQGKTFWGSISLFPHERDSGLIGFGYIEKKDKYRPVDMNGVGGWGSFGARDSVIVSKVAPLAYSVTAGGKEVLFRLNDPGAAPPRSLRLPRGEAFVAPCFDESGLRFSLVFDSTAQRLYWILNEDGFVPESLVEHSKDLLIGERTEFAFFNDSLNNRRILIGVEGYNVLNNNWYDGPFDQIPDNYILDGRVRLKDYVETAYPHVAGRIDRFGKYTGQPGTRVAIAPYLVYFARQDLVAVVETCRRESRSASELYSCLTQQVFIVPDDVYDISKPISGAR